jgi:uncharacterized protein
MLNEPLDLSHRDKVMDAIACCGLPFSEYSFTNLYLFRSIHDYRIVDDGTLLHIEGVTRDGVRYAMPLFDIHAEGVGAIEALAQNSGAVYPFHEKNIPLLDPEKFEWQYNPDDSDYIFTVEKLSTYPGRNLHKKRNLMKQFIENYSWRYEDLASGNADDAMKILDEWQSSSGKDKNTTDYQSCTEALANIELFNLTGALFYVGDDPAGFILGETLPGNSYAFHFAKGITRYKGIYQCMYNVFAKSLGRDHQWINFEQDLGIPELRQAKETYLPDLMGHKYRVRIKTS